MVSQARGEQSLYAAAAARVGEREGIGVKEAKDKGVGEGGRSSGIKGEGIGVRDTTFGKGETVVVFVGGGFEGTPELDVVGWQAAKIMKISQDRMTR